METTTIKLSKIIKDPELSEIFSDKFKRFSCRNKDVEDFLKNKAKEYERRGKSRTYIVTDIASGDVLAYYTLSLKSIRFTEEASKSAIKAIDGFSKDVDSVAVILLGQFGKDSVKGEFLSGVDLLNDALSYVYDASDIVGGRVCLLETDDADTNQKVIDFYSENGFKILQHDEKDKFFQMFRPLS